MSYSVEYPVSSEDTFITMSKMDIVTIVVTLFSFTPFVVAAIPYLHAAALLMTIYIGIRTIRKDKKRKNEK